jgi:hypothetical protein
MRTAAGRPMSSWSNGGTDDPAYADRRNFYKVEKTGY